MFHDHVRRKCSTTKIAVFASVAQLHRELRIKPKTIADWRGRATVAEQQNHAIKGAPP